MEREIESRQGGKEKKESDEIFFMAKDATKRNTENFCFKAINKVCQDKQIPAEFWFPKSADKTLS
jgi:hypothetical protein